MAGDWIKMRSDLFTHPKVVRMASALKADRLRTVGGLMAAWCLFDAHSVDGKLDGYAPESLDELIGWPGFSRAMAAIDWLKIGPDFLATPRFDEHNGQSAKRRATDSERKRNDRKTSAPEADKLRTREEKRREEEKPSSKVKAAPSQWSPPEWVPAKEWADFETMRKAIRNVPFTEAARDGVVRELEKFKAKGHDPAALLAHAVTNGHRTVYEPKPGAFNGAHVNKQEAIEASNKVVGKRWLAEMQAKEADASH